MAQRRNTLIEGRTPKVEFDPSAHEEKQLVGLEREYKYYSTKSGRHMPTKQETVIRLLCNEKSNLRHDLAVANAPSKKKADLMLSNELIQLLTEYDEFRETIQKKKAQMSEVNLQIYALKKKLELMKGEQISDLKIQQRILQGQTTLAALENKLEVAMKNFGLICFENRKLGETINFLMCDRAEFHKTWRKLISQLCLGKKIMMDLIEQATVAYDKRGEWCERLQALRKKAKKDFLDDENIMSLMSMRVDDNAKISNFYVNKNCRRIMLDLENTAMVKRHLKKKKLEHQLARYKRELQKIHEVAETSDFNEVINIFSRVEAENFAAFNYVNEINAEIEDIMEKLANLRIEIDETKVIQKIFKSQQVTSLEVLKRELEHIKGKRKQGEIKLHTISQTLDRSIEGVAELFKMCGCTNDPLVKLLGNQNDCNLWNVHLYLEILEKEINKKLVVAHHKEKVLANRKVISNMERIISYPLPVIYTLDQIVPANPCPLCAEHEQVSDVIDSLQKVLTREEVEKKLKIRLKLPDGLERIHNVSECHLPKSRKIMQLRYQ